MCIKFLRCDDDELTCYFVWPWKTRCLNINGTKRLSFALLCTEPTGPSIVLSWPVSKIPGTEATESNVWPPTHHYETGYAILKALWRVRSKFSRYHPFFTFLPRFVQFLNERSAQYGRIRRPRSAYVTIIAPYMKNVLQELSCYLPLIYSHGSLFMSQPQAKHLDIAIVGGGPTGLTCAVTLARKGILAHVYEAKASITCSVPLRARTDLRYQPLFGEIGVGIGLGRRYRRRSNADLT